MQRFKSGAEAEEKRQDPLRLATAALLLDIAYADGDFTPAEDGDILGFLKRAFALDDGEARDLVAAAGEIRARTIDHSPFPIPQGLTPITGAAARLAQNMTESLSVPTATSFRDITVDVLDGRRKDLNARLAAAGKKISYTHLVGFAIVRAAREYPVM